MIDRYRALSEDEKKKKLKIMIEFNAEYVSRKEIRGFEKHVWRRQLKKERNEWKNAKNYIEKIKQNHVWKSIQVDAVTNFIKNKVDSSSDI